MKWNSDLYTAKHAFVFNYGESLIELLAPKKEERILDLGCGTGELTHQISLICKDVVGMDKSAEMIEKAKREFPEVEFLVENAADFKFPEKFNAIFSNATLHWVTDYQSAVKCMYDNLLPAGRIVIEFGGKGNVQSIVNKLKEALEKRDYKKEAKMNPWYFPSIGEYSTELEKVGFKVSYAEHYDRPTKLADKETGIKDWIMMFGKVFFAEVTKEDIAEIAQEVQTDLQSKLFYDDNWFADYKRIRVIAEKLGDN